MSDIPLSANPARNLQPQMTWKVQGHFHPAKELYLDSRTCKEKLRHPKLKIVVQLTSTKDNQTATPYQGRHFMLSSVGINVSSCSIHIGIHSWAFVDFAITELKRGSNMFLSTCWSHSYGSRGSRDRPACTKICSLHSWRLQINTPKLISHVNIRYIPELGRQFSELFRISTLMQWNCCTFYNRL